MPCSRLLPASLLVCFFLTPTGRAEDAPSFTGYITSAPGRLPVLVDGRPLLLEGNTLYACNATVGTINIDRGVPTYPEGTRVAVSGKWDKKAAAWRTDALCAVALPAKTASGQGSIDAVTPSALTVDGRQLRLPRTGGWLTPAPPLTSANAPAQGQWLQYTADRQPDGSWMLRGATVREYLDNRAARSEQKWKPLTLVPPANGREGSFRPSLLTFAIKLSGDSALQDRLARVGATVIPAWEKTLAAQYPDERRFRFYAAKLHATDCQSFPDGTILMPETTAATLPEDAELAAVLAGCVAELEEEIAAVYANKELAANSVEAVNYLELAVPAGLIAGGAYQHHLRLLMEQQSARVALTYLQAAGYPAAAGPAAWERLEAKHDLSRPPGTRTAMMYEALIESRP